MRAALDASDHDRISAAITAAEADTAGEIYVVVSHITDNFRFLPAVWAALAAFLLPWPLHALTQLSWGRILLLQAIFFVVAAVILSHPALRRCLVPSVLLAEAARRHARAQFMAHGVHLTRRRTGVLIYVALIDRRVEIIADAEINSKVDQSTWDGIARDVTGAAREGRLVDGIVNAVARAGAVLAAHFPRRADDINELPDRVVEI
jgi:putative membrane protein